MDDKIGALSRSDLASIEQAYEEALESNSNSFGLHWVLIGALSQQGFRASSPAEAMRMAEGIIIRWYQLQQSKSDKSSNSTASTALWS